MSTPDAESANSAQGWPLEWSCAIWGHLLFGGTGTCWRCFEVVDIKLPPITGVSA